MIDDIVILGAARTPQGRARGALSNIAAVQLGGLAARAAIDRSTVPRDAITAAIIGQVLQAGAGQNPARQTAIAAGLPWSTPAHAVNSVCLSGARAVVDAARLIALGEADAVLAVGQESMTNAPHLLPGARLGWAYGTVGALDHAAHDGLTDAFENDSMGAATERHARSLGITRREQDELAAESHRRAAAAADAGRFAAELVVVETTDRRGLQRIEHDEGVRRDSDAESLGMLRPAFASDGTITAGNASPLSDGAAAVIVARGSWAREQGASILARITGWAEVAGPDTSLHSQPSRAITSALTRAGKSLESLDLVEINEAFAVVAIQSTRDLGLDPAIVNPDGGAIALGHPIGASGARLVAHAAHQIAAGRARHAAIALCGGGGQGQAIVLERA